MPKIQENALQLNITKTGFRDILHYDELIC